MNPFGLTAVVLASLGVFQHVFEIHPSMIVPCSIRKRHVGPRGGLSWVAATTVGWASFVWVDLIALDLPGALFDGPDWLLSRSRSCKQTHSILIIYSSFWFISERGGLPGSRFPQELFN